MKRNVYLEGEMGIRFGKEFQMVADSFTDVFRCLNVTFQLLCHIFKSVMKRT